MSKPLVLCYTPVANLAGVGRHLLDLARAGIPGYRLIYALPEGSLSDELRKVGAAVTTGNFGVASGARASISALRRLVKSVQPSVVHTHLAYADLVAMLALAGMKGVNGARIRSVSTEHGIAADSSLYQASRMAARLKLQIHSLRMHRTDHVIAVSDSTASQMRRQWGNAAPITVIKNGVNRIEGLRPQAGLRILSLARLAHEKRIGALLDGFAVLASEEPHSRLTIAGEGSEEQILKNRVRELGLQDRVTFPGFVDGAQAMAHHDVVAQLSAWENLSYTLLDAVAHGLGVVATDVGGNREIVPGHCFVDPSDAKAVAHALWEQGSRLEARPRLSADIPSIAAMTAQIAHVYREVLS